MASSCFYLILHSIFFVITIFVIQVLCDTGGVYHIEQAEKDNIAFVLLSRERRQSEKRTEIEEKIKVTKKPTSLDIKGTVPTLTDLPLEKHSLGASKKELTTAKGVNTSLDLSKTSHEHDTTPKHEVIHDSSPKHEDLHNSHDHDESAQSGDKTFHTSHNADANVNLNLSVSPPPSITPSSSSTTVKPFGKASGPVLTNLSVPEPDIQITKMSEFTFNETLKIHNITQEKKDNHLYYNSSIIIDPEMGKKYWVDLEKHPDVKVSDILSQAYRRAMTVKLSFDFPFYGHLIRNITIATGGFLYTGDYVHSWLAATQYIAPLMANFDTSISKHSFVKYVDNGTAFTVQWENVILQEKPDKGGFTFQCTLHKNGNIVFVYQQVAMIIQHIEDDQHPVKIGLSDAYIIDRTIFFVRRKTIYEYHRVQFPKQDIKNWTVIVLNALETCLDKKDCYSCLTEVKNFRCNWCANRCSNGMDRNRQDWITNSCDKSKVKSINECSKEEELLEKSQQMPNHSVQKDKDVNIGIAGVLGILFMICLGLGAGILFLYAYRNPHTPAGQFLIKYRPSQWSWGRGEARYTAATIHM